MLSRLMKHWAVVAMPELGNTPRWQKSALRLIYDDALPKDVGHVLEMSHKPLLGKGKSSTMSTVIILRHRIIPSKAAVGAAVIVDAAVHRGRHLTARVCKISSVF